VYPDPRVSELISQRFVPVRIHIKEQSTMWKRFDVRWTPTVLVLAPDGKEIRRVEGFLPQDDLLGQLELALGFLAVEEKDWATARQEFERVVERHPETDAGPEALYWTGVAKYSASHDPKELKELGRQFKERYTDTSWAKRASVW
jgi:thioredoxin-related protein